MEHLTQAQLQAILASPEGKQLLALLQKDSGAAFQKAADAARAGDYARVQALLKPVLGAEGQQLAQDLEKRFG